METSLLWLAVGVAGLAQGLTGFGFGIVAMAVLTPLVGGYRANLIVTPLAGACILFALWPVRRAIEWRRAVPLWCGGLLGTPVGVYVLQHTDEHLLRRLIGAGILVAAVTSLRGAGKGAKAAPPGWGFAAGTLGGVMAGAVAMGGPPAVVYAYRQPWPLAGVKSTLLLYFALTVVYRLALFAGSGMYHASLVWSTLVLVPVVAASTWLGSRLTERIPRRQVDRIVGVLLVLAGLGLLCK